MMTIQGEPSYTLMEDAMDKRKFTKQTVTVELTYKDLNYIESALRHSIREYGDNQMGNTPDLKRYCERVLSKIRKRHEAGMRENVGEVEWKRMRKFANKYIRDAKKMFKVK